MKYEKWAVFAVTLLVLIVASLSIIGTLLMLIIEKRNEQPVLLAMGADMRFIRGIFIREGLLISGIGGVAGIVIGVAIVALQEWLHIVKMPSGEFLVDSYPVELHATDIILVLISFVAVAWSVSRIATRTMIKSQRLCNEQ
jgi:lipoprotein-releasing system permease protein